MNSFKIEGLDCANCARELEEEILKIEGVKSVTVDFMLQKVLADCDESALIKVKELCNNFEEVKVVEESENTVNSSILGEQLKISGLCCANCGRELEEELNKIEGVQASVDFVNMRIALNSKNEQSREKAIFTITHFEDVKIVDGREKKSLIKSHLKEIMGIALSVAFFIPAVVLDALGLMQTELICAILGYVFYSIAYLAVGYRVLINTAKNIVKGKIFDENFLMTVASLGAVALGIVSGDGFLEGVAVMLLYQTGELLQSVAVGASRNSISALMDLKSERAVIIENGVQRVVRPEELKIGDTILIRAGEKVPVDCKIVRGESALDMKSLNGEPIPRDVKAGDEILSGSINISGALEAAVVREYKNSAVAKILEMVENATSKKSKPEKFITKFAKYYTPAVCVAAAVVAAIVPTIICAINSAFIWETYGEWIYAALNFLVISCPCALVISVPLTYFSGIGRCAKFGILVKGSTCLDELALAKIAAFDKTGTITEGAFRITEYTDLKTLQLAAAAEKFSNHPIAAAFAGVETPFVASSVKELAGRGVKCTVDGNVLLCGNARLLREEGVDFKVKESASTLIYVALNGAYAGVIAIDDAIKQGAAQAIEQLKASGIDHTVMLTGDSAARAAVSEKVGLDECFASLLPDDKLREAEKLKERGKLLYVGDGINDAPVMTVADCAVSMGKVGSDAAIEASDVVLVSDNLSLLPKGRRIAKRTRTIVFENIAGSLAVKLAIMVLSLVLPQFPLIISIVADVGVMLIAVLNAMRASLIK